jgi:hypothetical protein
VPVLDRGTPTPPGTLVFAPIDGRPSATVTDHVLDQAPPLAVGRLVESIPLRGAAAWILVPCLVSLREEFNRLAPARDKASDGSIGDTAHAASSSDHNPDETGATPYEDSDNINEVHAIDVDDDLKLSGWDMTRCVEIIAGRHRSGADDRLQNIIWDRHIISRSWNWDSWHAYTGASPHTEHAHFSARYTTAQESDTRPWGLLAEGDDMTFEADQVPRSYPAVSTTNPTLTGPWALGSARDLAHEARDLTKTLAVKVDLMQKAVLAAVQGVNEEAVLAAVNARAAELHQEIEETRLGNPSQSDEQIVAALVQLFGDRAPAIGRLMAGGTVA